MEFDKELEKTAYEWANNLCSEFYAGIVDPLNPLSSEALEIYAALKSFGFFQKYDHDNNAEVVKALAFARYRDLSWQKKHPPKPKMSKWERVTGRRPKR